MPELADKNVRRSSGGGGARRFKRAPPAPLSIRRQVFGPTLDRVTPNLEQSPQLGTAEQPLDVYSMTRRVGSAQ